MGGGQAAVTVVIPTMGRDSLAALLRALDTATGPPPVEVLVVDDRNGGQPLSLPETRLAVRVLRCGGRGPAAARNTGWRAARTEWVAFLDDDVLPDDDWPSAVADDLTGLDDDVAASVGRIVVPLPRHRRPTDDERDTLALTRSRWITADMAYRRAVLVEVGGFDERFPRAYREDADLALRVRQAGYSIAEGTRSTTHPPRNGDFWASVRRQRGNADNALMRRKHGPGWRAKAGEGRGRLGRHALTTLAGAAGLGLLATGRSAPAAMACGVWAGLTAQFAVRRVADGPRTPAEISRMAVTSAVIPPVACAHRLRGELGAAGHKAVLFDRDDTLIEDVPYLGDPEKVRPMPGAEQALDLLRRAGVLVGVVSNQSGVARGHITREELRAVNERVDELLGPFHAWQVCPHAPDDGCVCRKPKPGLVLRAAGALGVRPRRCVVIGDIGADVAAAAAAGAQAVLVPTARTMPGEIAECRRHAHVAADLPSAARLAMELL
ncbi:haloacid dehalogenase superfamily protein, subfamily IA, variant 3 with third motif having DD or ED [Saccharomonospora marina XMU15]|uniref:D,D-heptose 1,7-bisphosphate phosphatase n=1 Tax=Saccharomonospora marina XMU15 TaxID=882083 RepID=H5X2E7_9PSEU|nr:HAD-IIIA family hydrolase [Saccharomonospora marina]EHR49812.1 haloacid dehalogenase superfamily protein, subfamily IA, variant 3 with third motif having DD or ED [Saccharomonospora marina XMU15]